MHETIIIGGGINSLMTANLLSDAGHSVILFESRENIGGMASQEEFYPGYKCNLIHDHIPWINEELLKKLKLSKLDITFNFRDPYHIGLDDMQKHLIFSKDINQTIDSITTHSSKDADNWQYFTNYINKLTQFLKPIYTSIPPNISELNIKDALSLRGMFAPIKKHGSRGLVDFLRAAPMMMPELLDEWFESDLIRGNLSAKGVLHINQGPFSAATVLNFLHQHIFSNGEVFSSLIPEGGMNYFIKQIKDSAIKNGTKIKLNSPIKSIDCINKSCMGITTFSGNQYQADRIISGLDPYNTFIKLVGPENINPTFRRQLYNIKYRGSTARIHFALKNLPSIPGIHLDQMGAIFSISPSIEYIERAHDNVKYGDYAKSQQIEFTIPSIQNPEMSPKNSHVLSATVQHIPYQLKNHSWNESIRNDLSQSIINTLEKYIPNFSQHIESTKLITPLDFEENIGITEGNFHHGEMSLDQFYFMRPTMNCSQYKTPIKNLFLCGPGTHPGGGIHGINALNVVKTILNTKQ